MDGRYVANHPFDPVASPLAADIPMIIGCNANEMALFSLNDPAAFTMDEAELRRRLVGMVGEANTAKVLDVYRKADPAASPSALYMRAAGDRFIRRTTITATERKAAQAPPVYAYLFTWGSPALGGKLGATHTVEIPFVFDNTDVPTVMTKGGPEVKALAGRVSDAWIAFARTGNPNHKGLPTWARYDTAKRPTMILDVNCRLENDPDGATRRLWDTL
jgi:para-nitrobenzyl esterase